MNIELIKTVDIIPYEKNPRKNEQAIEMVAKSISKFGFKIPILLDKNKVIIAGHTRLKAAESLGMKEVPIILADDLSDEQVNALRIADNKVSEFSDWDNDLLKEELNLLPYDLIEFTGFNINELELLNTGWNADFPEIDNLETVDTPNIEKIIIMCENASQKNIIFEAVINLLKELDIKNAKVT